MIFDTNERKGVKILFICLLVYFAGVILGFMPFVRYCIVAFVEKFIMHKTLGMQHWMNYLLEFFYVLLILTVIPFIFSFFVIKKDISFINLTRVIATLVVFILHTSIVTNKDGTLFNSVYMKTFMLPAWAGVWIFFILGGFLAGKSFLTGRYQFSVNGLKKYYIKRFIKTIIPTFLFIFLCCVLSYPEWTKINIKQLLLKLFTFTYTGGPGVSGIGATWYVFTVVKFYLLVPFVCKFFDYLKEKKPVGLYITFFVLLILGLSYRLFANKIGLRWYDFIYVPFYANIDLFIGGICLAYITNFANHNVLKSRKIIRFFTLTALFAFILINAFTYNNYFYYQIIYPTIYLILISVNLYLFDFQFSEISDSKSNLIVKKFSDVSFEFYLFHSLILGRIIVWFNQSNVKILHFEVMITAFVISLIFAIGYNRVFRKRL